MTEVKTALDMLVDILKLTWYCGPANTNKPFISLKYICRYEPPGVHDSWGNEWEITLHTIYFQWRKHTGEWVVTDRLPKFKGKTPDICISFALQYVNNILLAGRLKDDTPDWAKGM